jgi:hypothetical protein
MCVRVVSTSLWIYLVPRAFLYLCLFESFYYEIGNFEKYSFFKMKKWTPDMVQLML